ncbi:MAG: nuclear transport factor 2 family protein [Chthoniobacterales bacterium]
MNPQPLDIVRQTYASYDSGEFARVYQLLSPEIEIRQTTELPWGGIYKGFAGFHEFFEKLHARTSNKLKPIIYIPAGEDVAVVGRVVGVVHATKKPIDCDFVHVWTVREQLITRIQNYVDTSAVKAALTV